MCVGSSFRTVHAEARQTSLSWLAAVTSCDEVSRQTYPVLSSCQSDLVLLGPRQALPDVLQAATLNAEFYAEEILGDRLVE